MSLIVITQFLQAFRSRMALALTALGLLGHRPWAILDRKALRNCVIVILYTFLQHHSKQFITRREHMGSTKWCLKFHEIFGVCLQTLLCPITVVIVFVDAKQYCEITILDCTQPSTNIFHTLSNVNQTFIEDFSAVC